MTPSLNLLQNTHIPVLDYLRTRVAEQTPREGRSDSLLSGLRYYRFSQPIEYQKKQLLMPGLVVVLQGSKRVKLASRALCYDDTCYLVLGSDAICYGTVVTATADRPYLAIHLDLPPALLVKASIALADLDHSNEDATPHQSYTTPINIEVLDAFTRLVNTTECAVNRATIAPLILEEIIIRLLRSEVAQGIRQLAAVSRIATRIQKSLNFIQAEFHRPLGISELAAQIAMSPSHYSHSFRQVAGVTPMRHLKNVRLDAAKGLLLGNSLRTAEVAAQVGFESVEHFTREFRNRFDMTPTQYVIDMSHS